MFFFIIVSEFCTCISAGDPHIRTYDRAMLHVMGICKYILSALVDTKDPCAYTVETTTEKRNSRPVSYNKRVDFTIGNVVYSILKGNEVLVSYLTTQFTMHVPINTKEWRRQPAIVYFGWNRSNECIIDVNVNASKIKKKKNTNLISVQSLQRSLFFNNLYWKRCQRYQKGNIQTHKWKINRQRHDLKRKDK